MSRISRLTLTIFLIFLSTGAWGSTPVIFAEHYYKLYHRHLQATSDNIIENIYYLTRALERPFANPLYALAKIENEKEWEKYKYLFKMQVNLLLVDAHLQLGLRHDKQNAYFYNYPWKAQNLDTLDTAEEIYRYALYYWEEAKKWSALAEDRRFTWMYLTDIQSWEDRSYRIQEGKLDYERTIQRKLAKLQKVRETFEAMDENTYLAP